MLDGEPVAVKVLRPRVAAGVRQDLALLDGLLRPLTDAFPALDARAIVRELAERVLEELDLEHEADVQRRFHRALRGHPAFAVAPAHTALARENVLVTGWIEGTPIARDLLVVPAVGDEPWDGGWFEPLNHALYPPLTSRLGWPAGTAVQWTLGLIAVTTLATAAHRTVWISRRLRASRPPA